MVVFTCNSCGDSLQKPKVEKHYSTVCRGGKSLTCVDCFKDFKDEEYVAHTKCITEEERYAAKGTIVGGIVKKGDVKQQSWIEMIQSVINNPSNATHGQQKIFDIISNSVNVPRKKNKFLNFIKNAGGFKINMNDIEAVWNLIEKEKTQQSEIVENSKAEDQSKIVEENGTTANQTINSVEIAPENKPKKKKVKHVDVQETVNSEANKTDSDAHKKKKNKLKNIQENSTTATNIDCNKPEEIMEIENKEPRKKKKRTKTVNRDDHEQSANEIQLTAEDAINNKDSKKKRKSDCIEQSENIEQVANKEVKSKKKKSKDVIQVQEIKELDPKIISEHGKLKKRKSKKAIPVLDTKMTEQENDHVSESTKIEDVVVTVTTDANSNDQVTEKMECKTSLKNGKIKKRKSTTNEQVADIKKTKKDEQEIENVPESVKTEKAPGNFSYVDQILNVLNEKIEISLKTLQKKVLNVYTQQTSIEPSSKTIKKFNKALKKISGVEISTDTVKLINN